jgi:hypothetical protein
MVRALFRAHEPQRLRLGAQWVKTANGRVAEEVVPVEHPELLPRYLRLEFFAYLRDVLEDEGVISLRSREERLPQWLEPADVCQDRIVRALFDKERPRSAAQPPVSVPDLVEPYDELEHALDGERRAEEMDSQALDAVLAAASSTTARVLLGALDRVHQRTSEIANAVGVSERTVFRALRDARCQLQARGADIDALRALARLRPRTWKPDDYSHHGLRLLLRAMTSEEVAERERGYRIPSSVHPSHLTANHEEIPVMTGTPTRNPNPDEIVTIRAFRDLDRVRLRNGDSRDLGVERWDHKTCTYAEALAEIERLRRAREKGDPVVHGIVRRAADVVPLIAGALDAVEAATAGPADEKSATRAAA